MIQLHEYDTVEMKKKHPCGSSLFEITYLASDSKIRCLGCGREILMNRIILERSVKKVVKQDDD